MKEYPKCNICDSERTIYIYKDLVECKDCGLRFFSPRISWEDLKIQIHNNTQAFDNEANSLYEKGIFWGEIKNPEEQIRLIKTYYNVLYQKIHSITKQPNSVLEIGCSIGRFLNTCKENNIKDIYGIDINPFSVKIANTKFNLSNVIHGDFFEFNIEKKFDWVVMLDYIEHSYHPKEDIKKAKKLLNSRGFLIIKTFLEDLDPDRKMYCPPWHAYHFFGDVLYKLLRVNNFRILYWQVEFIYQQVIIIAKSV